MNEEPKSLWKKSWLMPPWLRAWLWVTGATFLALIIISQFLPGGPRKAADWLVALTVFFAAGGAIAAIFLLLWTFIRWLRRGQNFRRFVFGLACLATLIALFYAEEDWRGWHAWNQFKHEWEAKGEKFDFTDFVPAPVPDDQNFAFAPVVASSYAMMLDKTGHEIYPRNTNVVDRLQLDLVDYHQGRAANVFGSDGPTNRGNWLIAQKTDLREWQNYYRWLATKTNAFAVSPQPQSPAQDVLLALSKYDPVVEDLLAAAKLPASRFPLEYDKDDPAAILLPHLAAMKRTSQFLQLRAIAELENGESEKALDDVKLSLRLADAIRTEPFIITHLVRIAILQIALQPVWEGLAEHRWSDAQLVVLGEEVAKLDFLADCQKTQKAEIFFSAQEASFLRRHRDYAKQFAQMGFNYPGDASFKFTIYRYMPGGWFYQSALKNGRTLMGYLPAVNLDRGTISLAIIRQADVTASNSVSAFDPLDGLKKIFNTEYLWEGNFLRKIAVGQTYVDLARTAIALERYRLAHGEFPEALDTLAPQFIAQVPHDVIGGGPLKYQRTADGQFILYSVGWNETDDGGAVVLKPGSTPSVDLDKGDWVWTYPGK
jgi:hypothetical protein